MRQLDKRDCDRSMSYLCHEQAWYLILDLRYRQTLCLESEAYECRFDMFRLTGIFCTNLLFVYNAKSGVGSVQCDGNPILFAYRYGS